MQGFHLKGFLGGSRDKAPSEKEKNRKYGLSSMQSDQIQRMKRLGCQDKAVVGKHVG